jgi:hypothetical protein
LFDGGKEIQSGNGPVKTGLSNTVLRSSTRQPIVETVVVVVVVIDR